MPNSTVIVIGADASQAIRELQRLKGEVQTIEPESEGVFSQVKSHWLAFSAAATAAILSLKQAWDFAEQTAKFYQSMQAFENTVRAFGKDATAVFEDLKKKSGGLLDNEALLQSANKAMSLGIEIEKLGDLMLIARAKSRDMGITVQQAFDDIITAIGRVSPKILDNLGLIVNEEQANKKYAEAIGKTVQQLTEYEKKQAFLNEVIKQGAEALKVHNVEQLTVYERMQKFQVTISNLKTEFGAFIVRLGTGAATIFHLIGEILNKVASIIVGPLKLIEMALNKLGITQSHFFQNWHEVFSDEIERHKKLMKEYWEATIAPTKELFGVTSSAVQHTKKLGDSINEATNKTKEKNEALEAWWREIMKEAEEAEKRLQERAKAEEWLKDRIIKLTVDEVEQKKMQILDEYQKYAEILGWKEELYKAFQMEIQKIDEEAYQKQLERMRSLLEKEKEILKERYQNTWQYIIEMANLVGGEAGRGLGMMMTGLKSITDIETGEDPYTKQYERVAQHYADLIQLKLDMYGESANIDAEWQALMLEQERMTQMQRMEIYRSYAQFLAGTFLYIYQMSGKHNQAMFTMYKAFSIAEAIISTYTGAARALKDFPYPFNIAVAAIITAAGMARVAAIAAQKPGGAATAAGTTGGGGFSYNQPELPSWEKEEKKTTPIINVHIYGNIVDQDAFARELLPSIQKAISDGVR